MYVPLTLVEQTFENSEYDQEIPQSQTTDNPDLDLSHIRQYLLMLLINYKNRSEIYIDIVDQ